MGMTAGGPCAPSGAGAFLWGAALIKYTRLPLLQHVYPAPFPGDVQPCAGIGLGDGLRASGCALHLASGTLALPFHSFQVKCLMTVCVCVRGVLVRDADQGA